MYVKEMPIFTRTFDFLSWLLPVSNHFPRAQRHAFTRRLLDAAFDLRERLEEANLRRGEKRNELLTLADEALARVRVYIRVNCWVQKKSIQPGYRFLIWRTYGL